jgi:hypothetical protein
VSPLPSRSELTWASLLQSALPLLSVWSSAFLLLLRLEKALQWASAAVPRHCEALLSHCEARSEAVLSLPQHRVDHRH